MLHLHPARHARHRRLDALTLQLRHTRRGIRPRRTHDCARPRRVPHLRRGLGRRGRVLGLRAASGARAESSVSGDAAARVRVRGAGAIQPGEARCTSVARRLLLHKGYAGVVNYGAGEGVFYLVGRSVFLGCEGTCV